MSMPTNDQASHDLAWAAFRYVAEEMNPIEAAAFEERLDHEQSAREAVAEVVRLCAAVRGEFQHTADVASDSRPSVAMRDTSTSWRSRLAAPAGWMSAGAAACWLLMAGLRLWHGPTGIDSAASHLPVVARSTAAESRQVAAAWTQVAEADAAESPVDESGVDPAATDDRDETLLEDEEDMAAPSWLTAAMIESDSAPPSPPRVPLSPDLPEKL